MNGLLYAKTERFDEWNKFHQKKLLWWATQCGVSPCYVSSIMNNRINIPGNFVGAAMHITRLDFDELFAFDPHISSRTFLGKGEVEMNGRILKKGNYRQLVDSTVRKELISLDFKKIVN